MFMPRMMQFLGKLLADWLRSSVVHGDVISTSVTVVSDGTITEEDILVLFYYLEAVDMKARYLETCLRGLFTATLCNDLMREQPTEVL